MTGGPAFDLAHLLAGSLVLVSLLMLYQDRLTALLNIYAIHALVLALSVACQAYIQGAPHLYITAAIALIFKAIVIPTALHRIVRQLGIHREIETVVGVGVTMLAGIALVALSMVVMLSVTAQSRPIETRSSSDVSQRRLPPSSPTPSWPARKPRLLLAPPPRSR